MPLLPFYDTGLELSMTKLLAIPPLPTRVSSDVEIMWPHSPSFLCLCSYIFIQSLSQKAEGAQRTQRVQRASERDLITLNSYLGGSITPCEHGPYSPQEMCSLPADERWGSSFLDESQAGAAAQPCLF